MTGLKIGSPAPPMTAGVGAPPAGVMYTANIENVPGWWSVDDVGTLHPLAKELARQIQRAVEASASGGARPHILDAYSRAMTALLQNGQGWYQANDPAHATKDRRDKLRAEVNSFLVSNAKHTGISSASAYSLVPLPSKSDVAKMRNHMTQRVLSMVATGLVSPAWVQNMWLTKMSADSFNDALDRHLSKVLDGLSMNMRSVLAATRGANMLAAASSLHTMTVDLDADMNILRVDVPVAGSTATMSADAEETNTSTKGTTTMTTSTPLVSDALMNEAITGRKFDSVSPEIAKLIDGTLNTLGLPGVHTIGRALNELAIKANAAATAKAPDGMTLKIGEAMEYKGGTGKLPSGHCVPKKASDVFGLSGAAAVPFNIEVPTYEWDAPHPYVPAIDPSYQFEPSQLLTLLVSILTDQRTWMYGDTGCGKTTIVEQIAARLNYPVIRVNFDSEITRMDLIGSKDLIVSPGTGSTVTTFTEGVLPRAMQMPCIFLADELDFIRADVAYVFQRALEGNGLTLPEDEGRVIIPHPGFRIIATANTQGQGDESGRYQGAKPQSAAFLDRFTAWISCKYMSDALCERMIKGKHPTLPADIVTSLVKYAREHWSAFAGGQVLTALSPRGLLCCAMTYTVYATTMAPKQALARAMQQTFIDRANNEDAQTIKGLISRVV